MRGCTYLTLTAPEGEGEALQTFHTIVLHEGQYFTKKLLVRHLHMSPPGLSPSIQSIGDKHRALQQGLADRERRQILQQLTQIGGVQRYKDELRQALAGT